jgi:TonB family protein
MTVLDFIPAMAVDAKMSGGGTPNATPPPPRPVVTPPAPAPAPAPQQQPPPSQPQKSFLEKLFTMAPPKPEPEPADTPEKIQAPKPAKPKIEIDKTLVKVSAKPDESEQAEARKEARIAEERREKAISSAVQSLRHNLSSSTSITIPGPGGASYANYAQIIKSIYTQAWIAPDDANDDEATTKVSITVARDGSIISAHVIDESGSAPVDRSVRDTLNRVQSLPPFPEDSTDSQRTFIINFNLKAKRLLG